MCGRVVRIVAIGMTGAALASGCAERPPSAAPKLSADIVATVGERELTAERMATVINRGELPLEAPAVRNVVELWLFYQLAGLAAAHDDSLAMAEEMDAGLWAELHGQRVQAYYDRIAPTLRPSSAAPPAQRYANGDVLAARHILVQVGVDAPDALLAASKDKAERIRTQVTAATFARFAEQSDDEATRDKGGDLGLFGENEMVPEFEEALRALAPGDVSDVVRSPFGFHVIYRKRFDEVRGALTEFLVQRDIAASELTYLEAMEAASAVALSQNAASVTKAVAFDPLRFATDSQVVATFQGGTLTAARLADWMSAYPVRGSPRPSIMRGTDSVAVLFVREVIRNELLSLKADSAGIALDDARLNDLRSSFRTNLGAAWTTMGVEPVTLRDSASTIRGREEVAGALVDAYFDRLTQNQSPYADVGYPVRRALRRMYPFAVNDAGILRAIELAGASR